METSKIYELISLVLAIIGMIVTFIRTGSIKEIKSMLYRSPDYQRDIKDEKAPLADNHKQEFSYLKTQYVLNENTGELEEKEEKLDLQKLINSSVETALDRMLNRFMPSENISESDEIFETYSDDLAAYGEVLEMAEDYRDKFGLGADVPVEQIFARLTEESKKLKDSIEKAKFDQAVKTEALKSDILKIKQENELLRNELKERKNETQKDDK